MKIEVETGEIKELYHVKSLKPHFYKTYASQEWLIPIDKDREFEDWLIERSEWHFKESFNYQRFDEYLINNIGAIKLYIES